jgi:threonine/homoserine/homoserine lactone efflux protein
MSDFLAFTAFAIAGAFTPGPNNTIAIATGARFGPWQVWPHALGTMIGFSSMLILASAGALAALLALPGAEPLLRFLGVGYLLWLAWRIGRSDGPQDRALARPLTVMQSGLIQFLSPKGWLLAISVAGAWFSRFSDAPLQVAAYIAWFALLCAASIALWASAGGLLRRWLQEAARLRAFNLVMGGLLAASALSLLV